MPGSRLRRALRHLLGNDDDSAREQDLARWRASVDDRLDELLRHQRVLVRDARADRKDEIKWRWRFRRQVDALLRLQALGGRHDLAAPHALEARRFQLRAQNEEDGIVLALLDAAGVATRRFVEIGCGSSGGNSAVLAFEFGWNGLMVDAGGGKIATLRRELAFNPGVHVVKARVTPDTFNPLLREHGCTGEIDFLSIDIDSVDYWLLDALEACTPRVLAMEYNARFGPGRAVTVPRTGLPEDAPKGYSGASLAAIEKKAREKGYGLVLCEGNGVNAFFVREGLAPTLPRLTADTAFRPQRRRLDDEAQGFGADEGLLAAIAARGLPLVDV